MLENTIPSIKSPTPFACTWRLIISGGNGAFEQMARWMPRDRSRERIGSASPSTLTILSQHVFDGRPEIADDLEQLRLRVCECDQRLAVIEEDPVDVRHLAYILSEWRNRRRSA